MTHIKFSSEVKYTFSGSASDLERIVNALKSLSIEDIENMASSVSFDTLGFNKVLEIQI